MSGGSCALLQDFFFFEDPFVPQTRKICINSIKNCILLTQFLLGTVLGTKNTMANKRDKKKIPALSNTVYTLTPWQLVYFYLMDTANLITDLVQVFVWASRKFRAK